MPHTKINSKCIIDINVKPRAICNFGLGENFLDIIPKAQFIKKY